MPAMGMAIFVPLPITLDQQQQVLDCSMPLPSDFPAAYAPQGLLAVLYNQKMLCCNLNALISSMEFL